VRTADDVREALALMLPKPKSGDWRPDVIGVDTLSLQARDDGWPLINGHRITQEMCTALQADRPEQADDFVFADLVELAREMGPPTSRASLLRSLPWEATARASNSTT
jgi:hypothetical protein